MFSSREGHRWRPAEWGLDPQHGDLRYHKRDGRGVSCWIFWELIIVGSKSVLSTIYRFRQDIWPKKTFVPDFGSSTLFCHTLADWVTPANNTLTTVLQQNHREPFVFFRCQWFNEWMYSWIKFFCPSPTHCVYNTYKHIFNAHFQWECTGQILC